MRRNPISSHLFGCVVSFPHTSVARTVAPLGYDIVLTDAQRSAIDPENLVRLIHTVSFCSEGSSLPVVRVPSAQSDLLTYAVDAGAAGIVFPHIEDDEQARKAVRKCRYPPVGERSLSPFSLTGQVTDITLCGKSFTEVADAHVAVICQIESARAVDHVDAIAAVPGVAALMLGPGDSRTDPKLPLSGRHEPEFLEAIDCLIKTSRHRLTPLMITTFKASVRHDHWLSGFSVHLAAADALSATNGFQTSLKDIKADLLANRSVHLERGIMEAAHGAA
ncbi:Putative hpcH/HpaI aldolase/citrate lyase domain, pyruvate kinase-like domain superfamily [Septoria linicola]|uniref:HpcH/HpaI aldolase/citrate lyase domain, pyruvate kinase-like domain superfamily n=1 Tax=Septoria linicola TaxID=215465 RepID=A0A9Q9B0M5_9PEZI|nr:Putative hpcH/HpaI aldolase/citrate lyase domain, pyruvate kinase-like domain superfamily [Septoria linicola]